MKPYARKVLRCRTFRGWAGGVLPLSLVLSQRLRLMAMVLNPKP